MAGIEKICEFSGEYSGYNMYNMKKNQLQIDKKYRKLFRKAEHILYLCEEPDWMGSTGYTLSVSDEKLQGCTEGNYTNWTRHVPTMKRKMKRLLRCKKLNIVSMSSEEYDSL